MKSINEADSPKVTYSINEACRVLGIGQSRLYEEINNGNLKAKKFGKRTLIQHSALEEWANRLMDYPITNGGGHG